MSFFEVTDLSVGYGKTDIMSHLSFSVEAGSVNGILGANGCGKTTVLKAICGILPHRGQCTLDGVCLEMLSAKQIARVCSYIPQRSGITIELTVLDVVMMGFNPQLGLLEYPSTEMKNRAMAALASVGLSGRESECYLALSEGQKQLCILARTMVADAKLCLMDEPESALDFRYRYHMLSVLRDRMAASGAAALVTLHDGSLALNFCDKLFLISGGGLLGVISPKTDPVEKMEALLSELYGSISLHTCTDRGGRTHWMILKETE